MNVFVVILLAKVSKYLQSCSVKSKLGAMAPMAPEKSINLIFCAIRNDSICKERKFYDKNTYLKFAKRKSYLPGSISLQSESATLYRKIFC
jgi:hypothetical protein